MATDNTGYKRSLTITVTKTVGTTVIYAHTYYGQHYSPYSITSLEEISDETLSGMTDGEFDARLSILKAYVETYELGINWNSAPVGNVAIGEGPIEYDPTFCVPPTTTTTTQLTTTTSTTNSTITTSSTSHATTTTTSHSSITTSSTSRSASTTTTSTSHAPVSTTTTTGQPLSLWINNASNDVVVTSIIVGGHAVSPLVSDLTPLNSVTTYSYYYNFDPNPDNNSIDVHVSSGSIGEKVSLISGDTLTLIGCEPMINGASTYTFYPSLLGYPMVAGHNYRIYIESGECGIIPTTTYHSTTTSTTRATTTTSTSRINTTTTSRVSTTTTSHVTTTTTTFGGDIFYVAAIGGSDSNSGTFSSRFLTIQKAIDVSSPGDMIIVGDGIYQTNSDQLFNLNKGGSSESRLVIKSENKWGAIMDGQDGITLYPFVFSTNASYIDIQDFEITGFHRGMWANTPEAPSNFITIKGNKIHDFGRNLVDGGGSLYVGRYHHDWTITQNLIYNIGTIAPDVVYNLDHAIYIIYTSPTLAEIPYNFTITNNIIWGCSGDAIQSGAYNVTIANNTFAWSNENYLGGRGFLVALSETAGGAENYTIANNIFYEALTVDSYSLRAYTTVVGWDVKNNMNYGGRMWYVDQPAQDIIDASGGNNYGQIDCENAEVNPLFVSASRIAPLMADFNLQPTSPAINAGVNIGLTVDYSGNSIIGLPDIGAYERQPQTFYVAKTGNDTNDGTISSPWLTIQKASDTVIAGDTVIVKNGTYSETVIIQTAGEIYAPIIFRSENQYGAIIDGGDIRDDGFIIQNAIQYITVSGFTVRNCLDNGIVCVGNASSHITIEKCKIHDIGRYVTTLDGGLDGIYISPLTRYWTITKNFFYNIGRTGPDSYFLNKDHCFYVGAGAGDTYHMFSYNICLNSSGCQITSGGNHESYLNNVFAWRTTNPMGGGGFFSMDAGVSYCTIANNQFYEPAIGWALQAVSDPIGWIVKNNMVYGGSMWESANAARLAAMAGNNYGQTDCENAEVDPLFVSAIRANIPSVDFSLQLTSPAINAGVDVGLTSDYNNDPIIGLPDIGTHEYQPTTYYVSIDGSDSNNGLSKLTPWLTVEHAVYVVMAGDTVIVTDGTYTTASTYISNIICNGTLSNPITFKSENQWGAKFNGRNNATTQGFYISEANHIIVEDFEFYGFQGGGIKIHESSDGIILRGNKIHAIGKQCTDTPWGQSAFHVTTCSNVILERNVVYDIGRYAAGENGCTPTTGYWMNHDHGIYLSSNVNTAMIRNNIFYDMTAGWCIHFYNDTNALNSNISVVNNTFADPNPNRIGHVLILTPMTNLLIANNIFYNPLTAGVSIYAGLTYTNCLIKNNMTYGGVISSGDPSGITITANIDNTDPLMINPANRIYTLSSNSPAINAGVEVGSSVDYNGSPIIGLPDIGAYEYQSATTTTTTNNISSTTTSRISTTTTSRVTTTTTTQGVRTFYVATTGVDTGGRGTEALPLLTIQYALNNVLYYGDTLIVEDGTYTTALTTNMITIWNTGGNLGNPITIKSRNKWGAILSGNNNTTAYCFMTTSNVSGFIIEDFEITQFANIGIRIGSTNSNIIVRGCNIHAIGKSCSDLDIGLSGINIQNCTNVFIDKNYIHDIGRYATGENGCTNVYTYWQSRDNGIMIGPNVTDVTISSNIIFDCKAGWGILQADYSTNTSHTRLKVINNTFSGYNPNRAGQVHIGAISVVDCIYANNIFYNTLTQGILITTEWCAASGTVFNNNMVSNGVTCVETLTGITKSGNYELTNPLMSDPSNLDFTLTAISPAINNGTAVGLTSDYVGNLIVGLPDIGAYEYQSTPETTTTSTSTTSTTQPVTTTTTSFVTTTTTTQAPRTFYVATTGIDAGSRGTELLPLLTIQYAITNYLTYGDTLIVEDGTYNASTSEYIALWIGGGSLAYPITIKSRNKWGAVLDGQTNLSNHCFVSSTASAGFVIQDFEIKGFSTTAFRISSSSYDIKIEGCKIHDIGRSCNDVNMSISGINISTGSNIILDRNEIYNIGRYATGENGCTNVNLYWQNRDNGIYLSNANTDITISNNIIYDCKAGWCITQAYYSGAVSQTRIKVINNTFAGYNPNKVGLIMLTAIDLVNCMYTNNIFHNTSESAILIDTDYVTASGTTINNNIISNGVDSSQTLTGITISGNLEVTDPLLVSPNINFNISASSPAINAGIDVGLSVDHANNDRTGLPDIGAYEYIPVSTTTTT